MATVKREEKHDKGFRSKGGNLSREQRLQDEEDAEAMREATSRAPRGWDRVEGGPEGTSDETE